MSATIKVEFDDGRAFWWEMPENIDGMSVRELLFQQIGEPSKIRKPLDFESLTGIANCYVAESNSFTYVIICQNYGNEVRLYQMPGDEDFCPVNASRANRFRLFSIHSGDMLPLASAISAAQDWDDEINGWEATDVG